ncbi:MAG: AEC family transporter [Paeniclostridium sp.]
MVLGYFLKYIKIFDQHTLDVMNKVVFKVFLPVLLFITFIQQIWRQYSTAN